MFRSSSGSYSPSGGTVISLPIGSVTERARWWALKVSERVCIEPDLYIQVPAGAALCILPDDDPEVARYNLLQTERQVGNVVIVIVTGGPENLEIIVWQEDMA